MPIIATANESQNFAPAPEGVHQAVCVDVIDKGMQPNKFREGKLQRKIDIAWQIAETRDDGKPFLVYKRYTLSLNEKANLRHDLESWRGKKFSRDEEMGFDVEKLIGANCLVNVQHNPVGEKVYANVVSVMPLVKGMPKMAPAADYVRQCDEADADQTTNQPDVDETPFVSLTDDDIPFMWVLPFLLPAMLAAHVVLS